MRCTESRELSSSDNAQKKNDFSAEILFNRKKGEFLFSSKESLIFLLENRFSVEKNEIFY